MAASVTLSVKPCGSSIFFTAFICRLTTCAISSLVRGRNMMVSSIRLRNYGRMVFFSISITFCFVSPTMVSLRTVRQYLKHTADLTIRHILQPKPSIIPSYHVISPYTPLPSFLPAQDIHALGQRCGALISAHFHAGGRIYLRHAVRQSAYATYPRRTGDGECLAVHAAHFLRQGQPNAAIVRRINLHRVRIKQLFTVSIAMEYC